MKGLFTFSKDERLTGKTNIDQLFNDGKSFTLFPFKVFYRLVEKNDEPFARVLIAIPKKKVKHAVDRNRLRRLVREAYRLHKSGLAECLESRSGRLHFAVIYTTQNIDISFPEVEIKITACLEKLVRIIASGPGK